MFISINVSAQHISTGSGDYETNTIWSDAPDEDGILTSRLHISAGHTISRTVDGNEDIVIDNSNDFYNPGDGNARYSGNIYGSFIVGGNFTHTFDGQGNNEAAPFRIHSGGRVEIFGNLTSTETIYVDEGGTLIVHGDLIIFEDNANPRSYIDGNVIVLGDAYLQDFNMDDTGILYVQGDIEIDGPTNRLDIDEDSGIYTEDPTPDYPAGENAQSDGTVDDLVDDYPDNDILEELEDLGVVSAVDQPTSFTYDNLVGTSAQLLWDFVGVEANGVIIVLSDATQTAKPTNGSVYNEGDVLTDGSIVIYVGGDLSTTYANFSATNTNYLQIWAVDASNNYSRAVSLTFKGLSSDDLLYEDFENGTNDWVFHRYQSGTSNYWIFGTDQAYAGDNCAYITTDGVTAGYNKDRRVDYDYLEKTVNIPATYKSAELSFYWKGIGEPGYDGCSVRTGTTVILANGSLTGEEDWVEEIVDVTDYIGGDFTLTFRWQNDQDGVGEDPAFCIDEVRITGSEVARPISFFYTSASSSQVDLEWEKSIDDDDVIIAYSPNGTIGRPEIGKTYSVGDILSNGGEVIYVGSATSFSHTGDFNDVLSYKIWSVKNSVYSSAVKLDVRTPIELPFSEDFEGDASMWDFSVGNTNAWIQGKAEASSGSQSAYISSDLGETASYDQDFAADTYLTLGVNLRNYESVSLSFNWKAGGEQYYRTVYDYGAVVVDDGSGDDVVGEIDEFYNEDTWTTHTIDLSDKIGSVVDLKFRWINDNNASSWPLSFCIDDVSLTGTIADPSDFIATNDETENTLTWIRNTYDNPDDVMIVWSTDADIGIPEEGIIYEAGDVIEGGGTVLYYGDLETVTHAPLNYATTYYYEAFSARDGIYSTGLATNVTTPSKVEIFEEDWEDGSDAGWDLSNSGNNNWLIEGTNTYAGTTGASAYIRNNTSTDADYNENSASTAWLNIDVDLNVTDLQSATLSFDWKCEGWYYTNRRNVYRDYGEVYVNDDLVSQSYEFLGSDSWQSRSIDLSNYIGSTVTLKFKWVNTGRGLTDGPLGFCVDNIYVGGSFTAKSILDNGIKLNSLISSLANTSTSAVSVFEFDITDQASSYNDATNIQQLVISKGSANTISSWSDAIAGAVLYGPGLESGMSGVVSSASITFTGDDMISLENTTGTYKLDVWLNTDLNANGISDNDIFDFVVSSEDIVTGEGDDFVEGQLIQSGEVKIDVVATELQFTQQPSEYATVDYPLAQVPIVSATDINGNVDIDYTETINITNSESIVMDPQGDAIYDISATSGIVTYSDLEFNSNGSGTVTLTAASGELTSAVSNEIHIDTYSIPEHGNNDSFISRVEINTIDNTSGKDETVYAQYLDQQTGLSVGVEYDVRVTVYNDGYATGYLNIWVDYNSDGTFTSTNPDERFEIGSTNALNAKDIISGKITIPSGTGTTRMRVQFIQNANAGPASTNEGESEDYTVVLSGKGWKGKNTDWDDINNWETGSVPIYDTDVYIPEHPSYGDIFPLISGVAEMNNLDIGQNAIFTIQPGAQVDINGNLTCASDNQFIIQNTSDLPASVIIKGTTNKASQVEWSYDNMRYWYIGHSIESPTAESYNDLRSLQSGQDYMLYNYGTNWKKITQTTDNLHDGASLEGYNVMFRYAMTVPVTHSGELINTDLTRELDDAGWYLMANPYPSYIDFAGSANWIFSADDFEQTIHIRTSEDTNGFAVSNFAESISTNGGSDIIAPGQCFWVKAKNAAEFGIMADARTHPSSTNPSLKSASEAEDDVFRFTWSNTYGEDEAAIAFRSSGNKEFTTRDSEKKMESGKNYPQAYTLKSGTNTSIDISSELNEERIIPVGCFANAAGTFVFKATNVGGFYSDVDLALEDKVTGEVYDLRITPELEFILEEGANDDRFVLYFTAHISTEIEEAIKAEESNMPTIYAVNGDAYIEVDANQLNNNIDNCFVEVFDFSGRKYMNLELLEAQTRFELPEGNKLWIIVVRIGNTTYQQKVSGF